VTSLAVAAIALGGLLAQWYGAVPLVIAIITSVLSFGLGRGWGSRFMWVWGATLIAAYMAQVSIISLQVDNCTEAYGEQWALRAVAVASFLPILAFRRNVSKVVAAVGIGLIVWMPAMVFSRRCGQAFVLQGLVILVILGTLIGALIWFTSRFAERQLDDLQQWRDLVDERTTLAARNLELLSWNQIGRSTRELLSGIAEGTIDPKADETRQRAALESESIRARIVSGRRALEDYRGSIARLGTALRERHVSVDIRDEDVSDSGVEISPAVMAWILATVEEFKPKAARIRQATSESDRELIVALEVLSVPNSYSDSGQIEVSGQRISIDVERGVVRMQDRLVISLKHEANRLALPADS
jgi:hypothetical protein